MARFVISVIGFISRLINDVNPSLLRTSFLAPLLAGRKYNAARDATGLYPARVPYSRDSTFVRGASERLAS